MLSKNWKRIVFKIFSKFFLGFFITLIGLSWGIPAIELSEQEAIILFTPRSVTKPIACVYIDDQYWDKIPPERVDSGECKLDFERLLDILPSADGNVRISVFIQGFDYSDTVEYFESSICRLNYRNNNATFSSFSPDTIPVWLVDYVFSRFDFLRQIRDRIITRGANWIADLNPIFMLPEQERLLLLGARPTLSPQRLDSDMDQMDSTEPIRTATTLWDPALDWRNKDGYNWVTPIKNQGSCGSCWAFSVNGTAESEFLIGLNKPSLRTGMDLSEQHQVSCDNTTNMGCDGGWTDLASNFLRDTGNPDESCFPYTSGSTGTEPPCSDRCADWASRVKKICSWNWINSGENVDTANLKAGIQDAPLSVCMRVCNDFSSYSGGVYVNTCTWSWEWEGWHAIILVGYNDSGEYWIMKNSWNTWWGDAGYAYMHYSESEYNESRFGTDALIHNYNLDADFSFIPTTPMVGETVNFTDNTSNCLSLISWDWDFGDGIGSSTAQNPNYSYTSDGTYTVTLVVCDQNFCDTVSYDITVSPNEPELEYFTHSINDVGGGDGDGYPESGETVMLLLTLKNNGGVAIDVDGTLSETDPYVSFTDNYSTWPDIPSGETRQSDYNHFSFLVADDDATCGHSVTFTLNWECESGTHTGSDNFNITLGCPSPSLEYESHIIDDASGGDGDGFPEPGETVAIPITLVHIGGAGAQDVSAILSTSDSYITITDNTAVWPDIPISDSRQSGPDHFDFQISPATPNGHNVNFIIDWDCYCGSGTDTFQITIGGPKPELIYTPPLNIDDSVYGDSDGYPESGETVVMGIFLRNDGNEPATSISGILSIADPYVSLTDSSATWGDIAVGDTLQSNPDHFTIKIDNDTPCGYDAPFELITTCNGDVVDTNYFDLTVGSPSPTLEYSSHSILTSTDGDIYLEPDEYAEMKIILTNSASVNAQEVSAIISEDDTYISVVESAANWNDIPPFGSMENNTPNFRIYADYDTPYLHTAELIIYWESYCGSGEDTFTIAIGDPDDIPAQAPDLISPFPFQRIGMGASSRTPQLEWYIPSDADDDDLHFITRVAISEDMSDAQMIDSRVDDTGFNPSLPVHQGAGTETYTVNSQGEGMLSQDSTYWWDISAYDGNRWGAYSDNRSFTIDTTRNLSDWFQTTTEQFNTGIANNVSIIDDKVTLTGANIVLDEDFESYSSQAEFETEWNVNGTQLIWQDTSFHSPDQAIHYYDNSTSARSYFYHSFSPLETGFLSCWSMTMATSDECEILRFYTDAGATRKGQVYYRQGYVAYWDGTTRHNMIAIDPGNWHHFQVNFDCPAGEVYVIIDSADTFGPYPFIDGAPANIDLVASGAVSYDGYTCDSYFDDYMVGQSTDSNSGMLTSLPILFQWNTGFPSWDKVIWNQDAEDSIIVAVDELSSGVWTPYDSTIANATSTAGTLDISGLTDTDTIRVRARLAIDGAIEPDLYDWAVQWSEATLGFQLRQLDGTEYTEIYATELEPGDTFWCDSAAGIWLDNQSSVPVNFISWIFDDTSYLPSDTLVWSIEYSPGCDTCAAGIAIYTNPRNPDIVDAQWLDELSQQIITGLPPDIDRYQYVFIIAPTDTVRYGEPDHRLELTIVVVPE